MPRPLASRTADLRQSEIRSMTRRAVEMGGVNLSQGLCDLPTPGPVKEAACRAIRQDNNTYAPMNGLACLREKIAEKLKAFNGISADPETEITVTSGATGGYTCALLALLEAGDRVLVFEPFYGYHAGTLKILGFEPVALRLEPPDWSIDFARLEELLAGGVKALLLNTPANPMGKVFSGLEMEKIAGLCRKYDLWVITDEIYEYITFGGHRHLSIGALEGMAGRTVTVSGFSKTLAMTGWRLGYAAGPAAVIGKMALVSDLIYICAPRPLQAGVASALGELDPGYYDSLRRIYGSKRELLSRALEKFGFAPLPLEGTYFLLADYSERYGAVGSLEAANRLLDETGIASVPAASFYSGGADRTWLRFCFAKEDRELERAGQLLEQASLVKG
ncbi:MAG: aminotransferase class I/II-fold pyridoxal phosphate-dependent enzyme [Candidatus Glassbacteria bacterium]|nr:aminotransferase class I/II-fold pyridoxal phosphate-dependent enzyme [Candidatus Glassbacteria bacterium]